MDFINPWEANKCIFCPHSRKKIVCNTGKTFILLVWLLPSLCSGIKFHTGKIIFFSLVAQYIYYFINNLASLSFYVFFVLSTLFQNLEEKQYNFLRNYYLQFKKSLKFGLFLTISPSKIGKKQRFSFKKRVLEN